MILAFGDSLTNGFGVGENASYPYFLMQKTEFKIIKAGVDGEFSTQGLSRLPKYLKEKPQLVILCHGANDILSRFSIKKLKTNLLEMIKQIKEFKAEVLLVGVPDYYSGNFEVHSIYREIAEETGVGLEEKVLCEIFKDSSLRNDYVHPNEQGYELMADAFVNATTALLRKEVQI